ncbi:MAG: formylglycine-generating enzyme family protein [Methanosarcinaceae archaeon]|nr:formylglycine-generating enzyme family protein [Methanosarcinaceae archaeon]
MEFVKVPSGEFMMGSNEYDWQKPVHKVTIRTSFYLGKYPVTQKQWKAVMGDNPSIFKGDDNPVENVSWDDAQKFIKKLNEMEGKDEYCLPSEAEWEYACRAGTTTRYYFGDDDSKLKDYAWYGENSGSKTHSVGQKKPNPWGFYDMHGNIWEWCQDRWHDDYDGAPSDGSVWESGSSSDRVFRGGCWYYYARNCRSAIRNYDVPGYRVDYLGFRVLRKL